MSVKSGGRVYLSRDSNRPVVSSHAADVKKNAGKQLLIIGCRLWNNVSTEVRYVAAPRTVPDRVICTGVDHATGQNYLLLWWHHRAIAAVTQKQTPDQNRLLGRPSHTANVGQSSAAVVKVVL